jgi:hypothetical protein
VIRRTVTSTSDSIDSLSNGRIITSIQIAVEAHPFFSQNTHIGDVCVVFYWDDNTKYFIHFTTGGDVFYKCRATGTWKKVSLT